MAETTARSNRRRLEHVNQVSAGDREYEDLPDPQPLRAYLGRA